MRPHKEGQHFVIIFLVLQTTVIPSPYQKEAANNSKHCWLKDLDGFQKLSITKELLVLKNVSL